MTKLKGNTASVDLEVHATAELELGATNFMPWAALELGATNSMSWAALELGATNCMVVATDFSVMGAFLDVQA